MKRTAEIVVGILGVLVYGLTAGLGGLMVWLQNNKGLLEDTLNEGAQDQPEVSTADMEAFLDVLGTGGWLLVGTSVVAIVLGIVAMVLLKGNNKPMAAGIIFLVTAVIGSIVTGGAGILAGIFYLVAGIMALVRKPQRLVER